MVPPNDLHILRSKLKPETKESLPWLSELPHEVLSQRVLDAFKTNGPKPWRLKPSKVEEHLREASDLLDQCLTVRDQIFELESKALLTALEFQSLTEHIAFDLKLAKLQLAIWRAEHGALIDLSEKDLESRAAESLRLANARMSLHSLSGSPLNFKERVDFHTGIYVELLRSALERIFNAKEGMQASFNVMVVDDPEDWNGDLSFIVTWVRLAIRAYEEGSQTERVANLSYNLVGDRLWNYRESTMEDVEDRAKGIPIGARVPLSAGIEFQFRTDTLLEFKIDISDLPWYFGTLGEVVRVIGVAVSLQARVTYNNFIEPDAKLDDLSREEFRAARIKRDIARLSYPGVIWRHFDEEVLYQPGEPKSVLPELPPDPPSQEPEERDRAYFEGTEINTDRIYDLERIPLRIDGPISDNFIVPVDNEPFIGTWSVVIGSRTGWSSLDYNDERGIYGVDVTVTFRVASRKRTRCQLPR